MDQGTPLWRRARRIALAACLFCLAIAAVSWLPAVTGSRNLSVTVATVEWLRSHGGNPIASQIENWYYTLKEPSKGGPALTSLPKVGAGAAGAGGEGSPRWRLRSPRWIIEAWRLPPSRHQPAAAVRRGRRDGP